MATKWRRGRNLSKEEREEQQKKRQRRSRNIASLVTFLASEKTVDRQKPYPFANILSVTNQSVPAFYTVKGYADPIVEGFYEAAVKSKRIFAPDFDPKVEYDTFIASYVGRYGDPAPAKRNAAKKSRKGVGGRQDGDLTKSVKAVLNEAEESGETLTFDIVCKKTWSLLYPGKDESRAISKWKIHTKDVRERLSRYAPQLSPPNRSKKRKS